MAAGWYQACFFFTDLRFDARRDRITGALQQIAKPRRMIEVARFESEADRRHELERGARFRDARPKPIVDLEVADRAVGPGNELRRSTWSQPGHVSPLATGKVDMV